jgi:hypothetical protein
MTPLEAFNHLRRILEQVRAGPFFPSPFLPNPLLTHRRPPPFSSCQVNAITAAHYASAMVLEAERRDRNMGSRATESAADADDAGVAFDDDTWDDDSQLYFEPEHGNVIFARYQTSGAIMCLGAGGRGISRWIAHLLHPFPIHISSSLNPAHGPNFSPFPPQAPTTAGASRWITLHRSWPKSSSAGRSP